MSELLSDLGVTIGPYPTGASNTITDVPGVRVGHTTLIGDDDLRGVRATLRVLTSRSRVGC